MSVEVTLEYKRVGNTMSSRGRILSRAGGLVTEEGDFDGVEFRPMMKQLAAVLANWPVDEVSELAVIIQRTDHAGLLPYKLDKQTVDLLRTDPVAGLEALSFSAVSPTVAEQTVKRELSPPTPPTLRTGNATLADAFGDAVAFKVRGHELECPGCGFWGMYTTPGLLSDPERVGQVFKTAFVCQKKCHGRFIVNCQKEWGFVEVKYLLDQTEFPAFYFPRVWNEGRPWVSREDLQKKYREYQQEKENVT
jgi:hypothetical protein